MKSNELMIGDIVTAHGKPIRVCGVFDNRVYGDNGCDVREAAVHAIPLTKEILELNGWIADEKSATTGYQGCHLMPENLHLSMWPDSNIVKWHNCDVSYVHRLQHALRLCGLNDLADNFKLSTTECNETTNEK